MAYEFSSPSSEAYTCLAVPGVVKELVTSAAECHAAANQLGKNYMTGSFNWPAGCFSNPHWTNFYFNTGGFNTYREDHIRICITNATKCSFTVQPHCEGAISWYMSSSSISREQAIQEVLAEGDKFASPSGVGDFKYCGSDGCCGCPGKCNKCWKLKTQTNVSCTKSYDCSTGQDCYNGFCQTTTTGACGTTMEQYRGLQWPRFNPYIQVWNSRTEVRPETCINWCNANIRQPSNAHTSAACYLNQNNNINGSRHWSCVVAYGLGNENLIGRTDQAWWNNWFASCSLSTRAAQVLTCGQQDKRHNGCTNLLTRATEKGCPVDGMDCNVTDAGACAELCWSTPECQSMAIRSDGCQLCAKDGTDTVTEAGSVVYSKSCLYQTTTTTADQTPMMTAAPVMTSQRTPLPDIFLPGSQLSVSCHPDSWRGAVSNGSRVQERVAITCVDGSWVVNPIENNLDTENSLAGFACEAGIRITSKGDTGSGLAEYNAAGRSGQWWQGHFPKRVLNGHGFCLLPEIMNSQSSSQTVKVSWAGCSPEENDGFLWDLVDVPSMPKFFKLQLRPQGHLSTGCVDVDGKLIKCSDIDSKQLLEAGMLQEYLQNWTSTHTPDLWRQCNVNGAACRNVQMSDCSKYMDCLVKVGQIGNPTFAEQVFVSAWRLTTENDNIRFEYKSSNPHYRPGTCAIKTTGCRQGGERPDDLESHGVVCPPHHGVTFFKLQKCSEAISSGSTTGYHYKFQCCEPHGIGECALEVTPWVSVTGDGVANATEALSAMSIECPSHHALHTFILEAKNPGGARASVRYDYMCCQIPAVQSMTIEESLSPRHESFHAYEGVYFPDQKVEGNLHMKLLYSYREQAPALQSNFSIGFDKYTGQWCLYANGNDICVQSSVTHPLDLAGDRFDISSLALKPEDEEGFHRERFQSPRKVRRIKLKKKANFETTNFEGSNFVGSSLSGGDFTASAYNQLSLQGYDSSRHVTWLPSAPQYAYYCALKDPNAWNTKGDMNSDEEKLLRKRHDIKELNKDPIRQQLDTYFDKNGGRLVDEGHPCEKYFMADSGLDRPDFLVPLDMQAMLVDTVSTGAGAARKTKKLNDKRRAQQAQPSKLKRQNAQKLVPSEQKEETNFEDSATAAELEELRSERASVNKRRANKGRIGNLANSEQRGLTIPVGEACKARHDRRSNRVGKLLLESDKKKLLADAILWAAKPLCRTIPSIKAIMAPMGAGASVGLNLADICISAVQGVHETTDVGFKQYHDAVDAWEKVNHLKDSDICGDGAIEARFHKVFCDLHCIEDAVLKGNHAILKSMQNLSETVISRIESLLLHYNQEVFAKIGETQTQINANDENLGRILSTNTEDLNSNLNSLGDQVTKHLNSVGGQLTAQVNSLGRQSTKNLNDIAKQTLDAMHQYTEYMNQAIGKNVISSLNGLNANLALVYNEIKAAADDTIATIDLGRRGTSTTATPLLLHQVVLELANATARLMSDLHGPAERQGFNEEITVPLLWKTAKQVHHRVDMATAALRSGNLTAAVSYVQTVLRSLRQSSSRIRGGRAVTENLADTFTRRSSAVLHPVRAYVFQGAMDATFAKQKLQVFREGQAAIMNRASSIQELSDQAEFFAASQMLVTFDQEIRHIQREFDHYLGVAQTYVTKHSQVVHDLQEGIDGSGCKSSEEVRLVGIGLAELRQSRKRHLGSFQHAWQSVTDGLMRLGDILVDGGLLLHFVRLATFGLSEELSKRGPVSLSEAALLLQEPLQERLTSYVGSFTQQVRQAYSISEQLATMWPDVDFAPSEEDAERLQNSWARVLQASKEVYVGLQPTGHLRWQLLLQITDSFRRQWLPPGVCSTAMQKEDAVFWGPAPSRDAFSLLLAKDGHWLLCEHGSGHVVNANLTTIPEMPKLDLTIFTSTLL